MANVLRAALLAQLRLPLLLHLPADMVWYETRVEPWQLSGMRVLNATSWTHSGVVPPCATVAETWKRLCDWRAGVDAGRSEATASSTRRSRRGRRRKARTIGATSDGDGETLPGDIDDIAAADDDDDDDDDDDNIVRSDEDGDHLERITGILGRISGIEPTVVATASSAEVSDLTIIDGNHRSLAIFAAELRRRHASRSHAELGGDLNQAGKWVQVPCGDGGVFSGGGRDDVGGDDAGGGNDSSGPRGCIRLFVGISAHFVARREQGAFHCREVDFFR